MAIRYFCAARHLHKEKVGLIKSDAIRAYHDRRARTHAEPGWCPGIERQRARDRARQEQERVAWRVTFRQYAKEYVAWAKLHHRG